jgi:hypothetical protein
MTSALDDLCGRRSEMVHVNLFKKLFEIDLSAPQGSARWWFVDGWVDHALTNEEVLFNWESRGVSEQLVAAVETIGCSTITRAP